MGKKKNQQFAEKNKIKNNFSNENHSLLRLNGALSSHGLFSEPHILSGGVVV